MPRKGTLRNLDLESHCHECKSSRIEPQSGYKGTDEVEHISSWKCRDCGYWWDDEGYNRTLHRADHSPPLPPA